MNDNPYLKNILELILTNTYLKSDLYRRLNIIRSYFEEKFYHADRGLTFDKFLLSKNFEIYDIKDLLKLRNIDSFFTRLNLYKTLNLLRDYINKLEYITIYIPTESNRLNLTAIGSWIRSNISKTALINFVIDPKVIGGCTFVRNGQVYDYSLKYFINKNRNTIFSLLNLYAN